MSRSCHQCDPPCPPEASDYQVKPLTKNLSVKIIIKRVPTLTPRDHAEEHHFPSSINAEQKGHWNPKPNLEINQILVRWNSYTLNKLPIWRCHKFSVNHKRMVHYCSSLFHFVEHSSNSTLLQAFCKPSITWSSSSMLYICTSIKHFQFALVSPSWCCICLSYL